MEFNVSKILNIQIEGEEIETFLMVLDNIKKNRRVLGFGKKFSKDEGVFIDDLHYNLIGQHEEDTDKGDE